MSAEQPNASESLAADGNLSLSAVGCGLVLVTAFLGWMFAGVHLAISSLVMRVAAKDLLTNALDSPPNEGQVGQWFGWFICAFLLGAAAGGFLLGRVGDRFGRAKAMALSILCYSIFSAASAYVQSPTQLLVLRFLTCMGVGGMWPNGIALVSEAWPNISRPFLAGAIGTAANVGILVFSVITCFVLITEAEWRWTLLFGASPMILGLFVLAAVPESPRWLHVRVEVSSDSDEAAEKKKSPFQVPEIFRSPILKTTAVGIALGTVPLFGGWGSSNWANAWASQVGDRASTTSQQQEESPSAPRVTNDPTLKSRVLIARSLPGSISSLLGGGLAVLLGRRRCYFLLSCAAFLSAQYLFWFLTPADPQFILWTGALGFFSGFFFGWLPLCLPEMFPTRVRSTGAGVSFNFGRILTALGVLVGAGLLKSVFEGDYAQIGRVTSFIYAIGIVIILFAPIESADELQD